MDASMLFLSATGTQTGNKNPFLPSPDVQSDTGWRQQYNFQIPFELTREVMFRFLKYKSTPVFTFW
jgi:hypothetical protein